MVKCGKPGCSEVLANGRQRRRHVHTQHRRLPHICAQCNNEPFLTDRALQQHIGDGHMRLDTGNRKPKTRRRKKKSASATSTLSTLTIPQPSVSSIGSLSNTFGSLRLGDTGGSPFSAPQASHSPSAQPCRNLFDARSSADLNRLIADKIQPDSSFLASCNMAVDELVNFLQHNAPATLRPIEVVKGGSLCKGTAVLGKSDVDIEVTIKGYHTVRDLKDNMDDILKELQRALERYPNIKVKGRTRHAVMVEQEKMGNTIEMDVLPIIDLSLGTQWSRDQVFARMENESSTIKRFYSPCLSPLQKTLFEGIPTQVKSLIRLVKYWKKEKLQGEDMHRTRWPKSYALELVILDRWATAGSPHSFDMTRALHSVLTSLVNHRTYAITLPGKRLYSETYLPLSAPYIIDPCNPFNDVYSMAGYDWDSTADKAKEWLAKPLFKGCYNTTLW